MEDVLFIVLGIAVETAYLFGSALAHIATATWPTDEADR